MELKWRGKTYNFTVRSMDAKKDGDGPGAKVTINKNIYAFDTESVALKDRYEPICYQISSKEAGESLTYLPEKARTLEIFLTEIIERFPEELDNHYIYLYAHNLLYDWLQMIKHYPDLLSIARTGIGLDEDYEIMEIDSIKVILRKGGLFTGNAPHFTIQLKESKRKWVDIMFRDTFSFFPVSLHKLGKDLKLSEADAKMERAEDIGKRDWRQEDYSEEKEYFEEYAKRDTKTTRIAAEKIRELHQAAGMQRLRVSAPGYAINKLFCIIPEGTELVNGTPDPGIMQLILDSYAGGRTGGIYHGHVERISVIDFHSSYPASGISLPSFGPNMQYISYPDPENLTKDELIEILEEGPAFLRIDGEEKDSLYPSLIHSIKGKLCPVYGKYQGIATTGVEALVGIKSGGLKIDKVRELVVLVEMEPPTVLPFKLFYSSAYERKAAAEKGSAEYLSAKLENNSSYGKLIESRTETPVADDVGDIILPYVEGMETDFGMMYYKEYIETKRPDAKQNFNDVFPGLIDHILEEFPDDSIKYANFKKLSLTELNYGRYAIPAAASLITATSRARLLAAMKVTKSLYWDTDSLFIEDFDKKEISRLLDKGNKWLPGYVLPLSIGEGLGEFDVEIENASGYLAGTKRYYLDDGNGHIKKALHGIPTAPYDMIKALATGENFSYDGRPRPKGAKETKEADEIGRFDSKRYESQFHLDDRLEWTRTAKGWTGKVKPISEMEVNTNEGDENGD